MEEKFTSIILYAWTLACIVILSLPHIYLSSELYVTFSLTDSLLYLDLPLSPCTAATTSTPIIVLKLNDIKIEFHPHSGKHSQTTSFKDYGRHIVPLPPLTDEEPWRLFYCQLDFEVAEFAVQSTLNNK